MVVKRCGFSWWFFMGFNQQNGVFLLVFTRPGKGTKPTGKIHHALPGGKLTISTGPFSMAMLVYQRVKYG